MDASLSLVISIVALASSWGWGWYRWRRTGDDLKVAGDLRAPLFQSAHTRRVRAGVSTLGGLTVVAVNRGRTSTEIHKMWLVDTNGRRTSCSLGERSAPLPVTVGARNRVYWYVDARTLGVMTKQGGNPLVVRPVMESGPGTLTRRRKMCIAVADEHLPGAGQRFTPTLAYRARTLRKCTKDLQSRVRAGEVGQVHFEAMPRPSNLRRRAHGSMSLHCGHRYQRRHSRARIRGRIAEGSDACARNWLRVAQ
jgi:hypothetical protein